MGFDAVDRQFRRPQPIKLECENCEATEGVEMEDSRTCYVHSGPIGGPDDPNRRIALCRPCAKQHHENWDEQWAGYQSGLL